MDLQTVSLSELQGIEGGVNWGAVGVAAAAGAWTVGLISSGLGSATGPGVLVCAALGAAAGGIGAGAGAIKATWDD